MKEISLESILKTDMTTVDHKHIVNAKTYNAINGIITHINETIDEGGFDEVQGLIILKSIRDGLNVPINTIQERLDDERK